MTATGNALQQPIIGWYCEGTFPALFTDSVSVAKRWMEVGSKVSAMVRAGDATKAHAPSAVHIVTADDAEPTASTVRVRSACSECAVECPNHEDPQPQSAIVLVSVEGPAHPPIERPPRLEPEKPQSLSRIHQGEPTRHS